MAVSVHENDAPAEPLRRRHMALVANGKAGALMGEGGQAGSLEDMLRDESAGLEVIGEDAGSLPERMRKAVDSGAEVIVVAGGDGSIACAASVLAGTQVALGMVPCGTMNLLAKDLGLNPEDREAAVRALAAGEVRLIDAGCVESAGEREGESHLFLCASMLGTPARLSRHREAGRKRGGGIFAWANFGRAAAQALVRNHSLRLTLKVNGRVLQRRTPSLTIVVNKLDDNSGRMFGRANLDGGMLVLYLVPRATVFRQVWRLLRTVVSGSLRGPDIEVIETSAVEIEGHGAALHVLVDGELRLLKPPLRYTIRPGALRVLAPGLGQNAGSARAGAA